MDLAILTFGIKPSRAKVVDYLPAYDSPGFGYIYINKKTSFDLEVYTKPFWKWTWIGVAIFCVAVPILMRILLSIGKQSIQLFKKSFISYLYFVYDNVSNHHLF